MILALITALLAPITSSHAEEAPELSNEYLSLVIRHLYRWHLDETALLVIDDAAELNVLMRYLKPALDDDDQSSYIELLIPQLSYAVILKRADYKISELEIEIKNADYRIIRAEKYDRPPAIPELYKAAALEKKGLMEYLFSVRNQREYPDHELIERMRAALRSHYASETNLVTKGPQTVYVAPISKVSNNLWVFWENARKIIRFSSDTDLDSKAFWSFEKLGVKMYDLEKDVVVSMAETAGSNAFVTRDWAARVLFNCVVFGQRMIIIPPDS